MRDSPFSIRTAVKEDLGRCVKLALEIPKEKESDYFPPADESKVRSVISSLIEKNTLIVYENNGIIVGLFGVTLDTFWWSNEVTLIDVLFYIMPEFRSYSAYKRMLLAAEDFAKINNVPLALLFFTAKDLGKKYKMISRKGYKTIGFWVMKR